MSFLDPNYVSTQFAAVSAGYLVAPAAELPLIKAQLPRPQTMRERAISEVIEYGIMYPREWDMRLMREKTP